MPRQMYGLGSFVKSIGKGIKKIVKSPIGKAAILGFGANALIPGGLGSLFSGGSGLAGMFGKAKSFIGGLSGMQKFGGALALGGAFGGMEDQQLDELKANPEALANYLRQYYKNLNPKDTPTQVEEFVQRNMQANGGRMGYDDGTNPKKDFLVKKGYGDMVKNMSVIEIDQLFNSVKGTTTAANTYREPAYMGGRMSYDDGTPDPTYTGNNMEDLPRGLQIDTTTSNPMPKEKSLKENLEFVKEIKGGVAPSTTIYMLKKYMDEALEKGQITKEQHIKMLMPFFGKTGEGVTRDFERYEEKMAYGGRMGYEDGTENPLAKIFKGDMKNNIKMPDGLEIMLKNMTPEERKRREIINKNNAITYKKIQESMMKRLPKISEEEKERRKIINEIRKKQAEEMGLPPYVSLMANGGRINRAYGSDDLVEQASGIEGLDININPKGVKELDLRDSGGFIPPVGVKEKADDIPAMLSNNEFVFTADAVRAAGGGSVNKGAQIMYDTMKKLENGGTV